MIETSSGGTLQGADVTLPAEVRQERIRHVLEQRGFVRVRELSRMFGVSTVTARSDLQALEERRLVQRIHGGAMPQLHGRGERSFEEVVAVRATEKARIAGTAAAMVSSGESILVDVGTTAAAFAAALVARSDLADVTVITNGLTIALAFEAAHPRFTIVVTGGTLRPKQHSLVDPLAGAVLQTLSVDTVFLGCNGVHSAAGITNINLPEAEIKRRMIAASQRCVVLADSFKLGTRALAPVCALDEVDVIVTDDGAPDDQLDALREQEVDVIVA